MNDQLVQTRISKQTLAKLRRLAKASGCSLATYVRQLIIRDTNRQGQSAL